MLEQKWLEDFVTVLLYKVSCDKIMLSQDKELSNGICTHNNLLVVICLVFRVTAAVNLANVTVKKMHHLSHKN